MSQFKELKLQLLKLQLELSALVKKLNEMISEEDKKEI